MLLFFPNQVTFTISEGTTLADLLALQLHRVEDDVRKIVDKAVKELGTEKVVAWSLCFLDSQCRHKHRSLF